MRRITLWALSTLSALVLLFSYHTSTSPTLAAATGSAITASQVVTPSTGTSSTTTAAGAAPPADATPTTTTGSSASGTATPTPSTSSPATSAAATTVVGDAVMTRYGNVQVQITVVAGKVTAAQVLQVPMEDRHDQEINSQAVPVYNGEVIDAQSAKIDVMSGATVTWGGYTQSLQSALDQAHL